METAKILANIKSIFEEYGKVHIADLTQLASLAGKSSAQGESEIHSVTPLVDLAQQVRQRQTGNKIELCAIVNGKCGLCSEDCAYCAQSGFHSAGLKMETYPLMEPNQILAAAQRAEEAGAVRFGIVTSGDHLRPDELLSVAKAVELVTEKTTLRCCGSLGRMEPWQLRTLKSAGLVRYHHNVETARSYFPMICTTHTYEERLETLLVARNEGLEICCGGILNLGETWEQRMEMACQLAELTPESVPINFLNPRPGTPLGRRALMDPLEAVLSIVLFRLVLPQTVLRLAGGRQESLGELEREGVRSGVNGLMVGDYLTTSGPAVANDMQMLDELGLVPSLIMAEEPPSVQMGRDGGWGVVVGDGRIVGEMTEGGGRGMGEVWGERKEEGEEEEGL